MKRWAITATLNPPQHVVSGRFGGSVLFCWYDKFLREWYWITGSSMEQIAEPPMILVEEQWARENRNLGRRIKVEKHLAIRRKKSEQLVLF